MAHLNVQALMSTFNEFSIMLNSYQFDIIAITETWLQDTQLQYKVRTDHTRNYTDLEILVVESRRIKTLPP